MAGIPQLALHGRDVVLTIFVGGNPLPQTDLAHSITVNEVNTQHVDKLLGRVEDRLDETPGHFETTIDLMYAGAQIVSQLIAQKAARAANIPFAPISIGMVWTNRDGSQSAYTLGTCTTNQSLKVGGKDEAIMHSLKVQSESLDEQEL